MNAVQTVKLSKELCGDYNPNATTNAELYILTTTNYSVPVFETREHDTYNPQIQIIPNISQLKDEITTTSRTKSSGIGEFEDPNINYVRTETEKTNKNPRYQIDILAPDMSAAYEIAYALELRLKDFMRTSFAEVGEMDWEQDDDSEIFYNTEYDSSVPLIRAYEGTEILEKVDTITENGSWILSDDGLFVQPYTDINDVYFYYRVGGNTLFSDGFAAKEKGIKSFTIDMSSLGYDIDREKDRWIIQLIIRYEETEELPIGGSFKEVLVND